MKLQNIKHKGKVFEASQKKLLIKETPVGNLSKETMGSQENGIIFF